MCLGWGLSAVPELKVRPCPFYCLQTEDRVSETSVPEQQSSSKEERSGMSKRTPEER